MDTVNMTSQSSRVVQYQVVASIRIQSQSRSMISSTANQLFHAKSGNDYMFLFLNLCADEA